MKVVLFQTFDQARFGGNSLKIFKMIKYQRAVGIRFEHPLINTLLNTLVEIVEWLPNEVHFAYDKLINLVLCHMLRIVYLGFLDIF